MGALVHIMAGPRTGDKPLSEAIFVCCTDAYIREVGGLVKPAEVEYDDIMAWNAFCIIGTLWDESTDILTTGQ